jgi:hypothetical protein
VNTCPKSSVPKVFSFSRFLTPANLAAADSIPDLQLYNQRVRHMVRPTKRS